ncbi:hypothetical protein M569_06957, partial [Genlisea aurea]
FDEAFAVLGYNVKSSDMAEVAEKIQQLDEAMGSFEREGLSQLLASDAVHYNPSDLCSWLESMISGLNPLSGFESSPDPFLDSSTASVNSCPPRIDLDFGSDLISIPGEAIYPRPPAKRARYPVSVEPPPAAARSLLVDSQENGIRLVHTLVACAEAIQQEDAELAEALVKNIGFLAASQAGAMRKVAAYFAEALARRIYGLRPPAAAAAAGDSGFTDDALQMNFYEACPYLKFAHFTANQAILEAFAGKSRVHVIDFTMKQGMQWPALLHALALRPGGPPAVRLTGVRYSSRDGSAEIGWRLARLAEDVEVEFKYEEITVADSIAELDSSMLDVREGEAVAVNSVFELHRLLSRPGSIDGVLKLVRELKPEILTVVEQEANHGGNIFLDRFNEALHYYSTLFDSLESGAAAAAAADGSATDEDRLMTEVYLGRQICDIVACEGADRVERHETLAQWRARFGSRGFTPVRLGSNVYKQAILLLGLFAGGDGYRVEENDGCLMLGWHTRPLIATSAWK